MANSVQIPVRKLPIVLAEQQERRAPMMAPRIVTVALKTVTVVLKTQPADPMAVLLLLEAVTLVERTDWQEVMLPHRLVQMLSHRGQSRLAEQAAYRLLEAQLRAQPIRPLLPTFRFP